MESMIADEFPTKIVNLQPSVNQNNISIYKKVFNYWNICLVVKAEKLNYKN